MKQEQVIELAKQVGALSEIIGFGRDDGILFTPFELEEFIYLIEQKTLGKVVEKLDVIEEEEPGTVWQPGTPSKVILNLAKDTQ